MYGEPVTRLLRPTKRMLSKRDAVACSTGNATNVKRGLPDRRRTSRYGRGDQKRVTIVDGVVGDREKLTTNTELGSCARYYRNGCTCVERLQPSINNDWLTNPKLRCRSDAKGWSD
ncbi:MAG: hypothetical protein EBS66_10705 [Betaproteobacteria bacterium]|nr:hypothetical protein [Betaproteobacteria bacterium]